LDWSLLGHFSRRNCLLKHVIEGKIEWTRRQSRRSQHLLDDLKVKRKELNFKVETLDRTSWRTSFGRGYEPVARQAYEMNEFVKYKTSQMSNINLGFNVSV